MKYSDRSGCCNQIEIDKARKIARYYDIKLEIVDFDLTDKNKDNIVLASSLDLLPENPSKDGFNQAALIHTLTYYGYCPPKKDTLYNFS
jgi:7-cyano-7-deazaguanine synthase in queuosine biosynthesis